MRVVFVNEKRVWMARHVLHTGDQVEVQTPAVMSTAEPAIPILFEDATCIVGTSRLEFWQTGRTAWKTGSEDSCAARLSRPCTAWIAKPRDAFSAPGMRRESGDRGIVRKPSRDQDVPRHFFGPGSPDLREITAPIDGKTAITRLTLLSSTRIASHLKLSIETGRTHQIRKHMVTIRHPVLGDKVYSTNIQPRPELRASRVRCSRHQPHLPAPNERRTGPRQGPLPADYSGCLRMLKLT